MASSFNTGDIVQLKSGGPTMTVVKNEDTYGITCKWFAGKKLEGGRFPAGALIKASEAEKKD